MLVLCMHHLIGSSQKLHVSGATYCDTYFVDEDTEAQKGHGVGTL